MTSPTKAICICGKEVSLKSDGRKLANRLAHLFRKLDSLWEQRAALGPLPEIVADIEHANHEIEELLEYHKMMKEMQS